MWAVRGQKKVARQCTGSQKEICSSKDALAHYFLCDVLE